MLDFCLQGESHAIRLHVESGSTYWVASHWSVRSTREWKTPALQADPPGLKFLLMGNVAFEGGNYDEALRSYMQVPQIETTPYAINRLALTYHMLNRLSEAEATYKSATRRDKEMSAAYNNLGALYYGRRKFKDAEKRFKDALKYGDAQSSVLRHNLRAAKYARENGKQIRPVLLQRW